MIKDRLIAVVIVRDGKVVQSEKFNHTHVIHYDAYHAVEAFSRWSIDEIVVLNVSKEKSTSDQFVEIVSHISKVCYVPLSAGGFIDCEEYGASLIRNGADKLVVNTANKFNPEVVSALSNRFGKQCIVASIDYKYDDSPHGGRVYVDRGSVPISEMLEDWSRYCVELGAGEIFFNNICHDGNRQGYDLDGLQKVVSSVSVPVIAFGGVFDWKHLAEGLDVGASAVAAANIFHYKEMATKQAKRFLIRKGYNIREQL